MSAHVLVVDDERLVRWAVSETLGARGYEVAEASDAQSAMRAFATPGCAADLVLLDLRLPDADDLSVMSFIRARSPGTPVILMTAFGTRDIVDEATAQGAVFISKPFDMNELASVVERTLAVRPIY